MKEFNSNQPIIQSAAAISALPVPNQHNNYALYVGLDVHKETIAIAVAKHGRSKPKAALKNNPF